MNDATALDALGFSRDAIVASTLGRRTPLPSLLIHVAIAAVWAVLFVRAFLPHGLLVWGIGLAYVGYDSSLQVFVTLATFGLHRPGLRRPPTGAPPEPVGVVIAALDEALVLERTIEALGRQTLPPRSILLADDGSTDGTAALMARRYGIVTPPPVGGVSAASPVMPSLRWLRLAHGGKARALNAAVLALDEPLLVTVDADTALAPDALRAMATAFADDPGLVAATGVLAPRCGPGFGPAVFEWFQRLEYIRNFLARRAWMRIDCLLLISGAFAGFRRSALVAVGGFDPACLVEDYEVIHRLRRYGILQKLGWRSAVIGTATADTSAPATLGAFLRQRRRWFGGFLQTQLRYRDMVGDRRFGRLGLLMLPVKAIDAFQPAYGITALLILIGEIATGHAHLAAAIGVVIGAKIVLDGAFLLMALHAHARWTGVRPPIGRGTALVSLLIEPFSFQVLRHLGALWGWQAFLRGAGDWNRGRVRQRG